MLSVGESKQNPKPKTSAIGGRAQGSRYKWPPVTPLELEGNDPFSGRVGELAMDLGGIVDLIETVFAIFACATLFLCLAAAAYGAQHEAQPDTTIIRKLLAMLCGCLVGVAVAVSHRDCVPGH